MQAKIENDRHFRHNRTSVKIIEAKVTKAIWPCTILNQVVNDLAPFCQSQMILSWALPLETVWQHCQTVESNKICPLTRCLTWGCLRWYQAFSYELKPCTSHSCEPFAAHVFQAVRMSPNYWILFLAGKFIFFVVMMGDKRSPVAVLIRLPVAVRDSGFPPF